ncbi:hypothetical protein B0A50_01780 [Salinomyces thailandicus]|uniref:AB hydrolase-1 domain-containing protein n=1 Tax=Salinomyces thailandicus TaxID=706561 RepID=A0A4U0UAH9_9PEZI|nr:hypothetical protein B0A50_01780 [Salinomyces thailandica]
MPTLDANGITINYRFDSPPTADQPKQQQPNPQHNQQADLLVLVNGLADDLTTWDYQVPAFLAAGYTILRYDNRGIGHTSRPLGPYTAELLADDLRALLQQLEIENFHLLGVSMGGMIAQAYALKYPNNDDDDDDQSSPPSSTIARSSEPRMTSLSLCCTYAEPSAFCTRMFALWADMARRMSVQDVMRDVTLWAFTVAFFRTRTAELEEVERAMAGLDMGLAEYFAQLNVIQTFDSTGALERLRAGGKTLGGVPLERVMVLAGRTDILIPVGLSQELSEMVGGRFVTVEGGHGCLWEFADDFNQTVLDFLRDAHR